MNTPAAQEIAALRAAVDRLAHNLGVGPDPRPPDAIWHDNDGSAFAEWTVVPGDRYCEWTSEGQPLRVRAGRVDQVPTLFLVDHRGDMRPLSVDQGYRLIAALASALARYGDDLARQRERRAVTVTKPH